MENKYGRFIVQGVRGELIYITHVTKTEESGGILFFYHETRLMFGIPSHAFYTVTELEPEWPDPTNFTVIYNQFGSRSR